MKIITGGAGFIGSNLVAALQQQNAGRLVVADVLGSDQKWRNLAGRTLWDFVFPVDLLAYLDAHASEVTHVFHLGAISATTERDADLIMRENFVLSRALWMWCAQHKKSFIYASSAATYGGGEHGFVDGLDSAYLQKLAPLNPYGWSKLLFDRFVLEALTTGAPAPRQWAGLKFFNVYGPNEYHKGGMKSVISPFLSQLETGEMRLFKSHNPNYADGAQQRDFIWVDDCVDVMVWLMNHPEVNGLFNVGTGQARTFADVARSVAMAAGRELKITYVDMPETLQAQYQYWTEADLAHLRKAGYAKPFTTLEDGVRQYVQGYLMQSNPYR